MDFQYGSTVRQHFPGGLRAAAAGRDGRRPTLFMRRDTVEAAWRWVMPILDRWAEQKDAPIPRYPAGDWGPPEADRLIESTGRRWRDL